MGAEDAEKSEKVPAKKPMRLHEPLFYRTDVPSFSKYAMTTQPFFLLALIHFAGCVSHAIPLAHVVAMATDRALILYPRRLSWYYRRDQLRRTVYCPRSHDKIGGPKVLVLFNTIQAISILWLLPAQELWYFILFPSSSGWRSEEK